jgi:glutathione synthase/RimK-type ligase-like ATP-grasp enzyme
LSNPENSSVTKLACLEKARQAGMKIPRTIVATRKAEIAKLLQEGQYITKPMYEVRTMEIDNKKFVPWTRKLTADDIKDLPELIYPSLVQECVEKQFELRVFVLEDEIFPMTIFSQAYEETSVDFRASGPSNYMRKSPITLPKELNNSIRKFMKLMALNTGSIDILYSTTGEYYFLEVNPVGQFGMTSVPCNYFLEKRIAQLLIDKDNEFKRR